MVALWGYCVIIHTAMPKIYMTAADCNELEKSQVLHPSLQAVKSWMYDGHMV